MILFSYALLFFVLFSISIAAPTPQESIKTLGVRSVGRVFYMNSNVLVRLVP